jgi:hypothetical protein
MLVAKEAITITVGARPVRYGRITVIDRRTGDPVEIDDTDNDPVDEGDEGVPYTFRRNQRVRADHPAVEACPSAFIPADEIDEIDQLPEA